MKDKQNVIRKFSRLYVILTHLHTHTHTFTPKDKHIHAWKLNIKERSPCLVCPVFRILTKQKYIQLISHFFNLIYISF